MRVKKYDNVIPREKRELISNRYKRITTAINREFWKTESDTANSIYVGSYGRNTAISSSDIDILIELPTSEFDSFNNLKGNVQSRLLQSVKESIKKTYPNTDIRADGQIIKIYFSDEIIFEILPAFKRWDNIFVYPDTNMGGNWMSTNPKAEQEAIKEKNRHSNGLLVSTCRHMRYIRDYYFRSYYLSGIVIDSFVYHAIGNWHFTEYEKNKNPQETYEQSLLYYYKINSIFLDRLDLKAPGSNDKVATDKSVNCLEKVLKCMVD